MELEMPVLTGIFFVKFGLASAGAGGGRRYAATPLDRSSTKILVILD